MRYIDWILPLNVKNTLKKYFQKEVPVVSKVDDKIEINPLLERNKVLNNSVGENKTCYILACGPSINEMDLSFLKGEDCISVSNFFVHPLYNDIQPNYHIFAPTHEPITEEQYSLWIDDYQRRTKFSSNLITCSDDKKVTDIIDEQFHIQRFYYELSKIMPETFNEIKLDNKLPHIHTVVHIAIYTAISLGYKNIKLLGVDHNWLYNNGESKHFYEEKESKLVEKGYKEFGWRDLGGWFRSLANIWDIYKSIKVYSNKNNIIIKNSTKNSKLDVFDFELID